MPLAQAKLIWPGSDVTSGFWQAVVISACMVGTLAGHDAPPVSSTVTSPTVSASTAALSAAMTLRRRKKPGR